MSAVALSKQAVSLGLQPKVCAHRRCKKLPTEAHDVRSWFRPEQDEHPRHYEVCEKHARYFDQPFDKYAAQAVKDDLVDWATYNGFAISVHREAMRICLSTVLDYARHRPELLAEHVLATVPNVLGVDPRPAPTSRADD